MATTIVTLFLVITSNASVSARQQRMTFAECQAEMTAARATAHANELVAGGCILTPGRSFAASRGESR